MKKESFSLEIPRLFFLKVACFCCSPQFSSSSIRIMSHPEISTTSRAKDMIHEAIRDEAGDKKSISIIFVLLGHATVDYLKLILIRTAIVLIKQYNFIDVDN